MDNKASECLKIPVIVGVTGHIDVADDELFVMDKLESFWRVVRDILGPETPIVLLSSIAQGADHYVVKSMPKDIKRYCVVLPFAQADYEQDFVKYAQKPNALEEFRQDLAGAYKVIQCGAEVRDYAKASDYVRSHSDILITLWDGYESLNEDRSPKSGGTYHQIRTAFDMDDILIHHQEKAHLIVNLTVKRKGEHKDYEKQVYRFPDVTTSALNVIKWDEEQGYSTQPLQEWQEQFKSTNEGRDDDEDIDINTVLHRINTVLHRIREHNQQKLQIPSDEARNYLYGKLKELESFAKDFAIIQSDFARYELFDKLAESHQIPHKSQFAWIALLSVVIGILGQAWGGFTFAADDNLHEWIMHGVILMYLLGCLWLFMWGRRISRQDHYGKYVQLRVIAELMRLKMFWKLAGIKDSFVDYILADSASFWFALPVCNWEVWDDALTPDESSYVAEGKGLPGVCKGWLENQQTYYSGYLLAEPTHSSLKQAIEACKGKSPFSREWWQNSFKKIQYILTQDDNSQNNAQKEPFFSKKRWLNYKKRWLKYFKKYERLDGFFSMLKTVFFVGAFTLASLLIIVFISSKIWLFDHAEFLHLSYYREFIVGICLFVWATLGWLLEKNGWNSLAKQYRTTRKLFDKAIKIVGNEKENIDVRRRAVKELMLFCHSENAEWKNIKNDSKPEPMM